MPKSTRNVFELVAVAENHSDFSFVKAIMTDEGAVGGVGSVGGFHPSSRPFNLHTTAANLPDFVNVSDLFFWGHLVLDSCGARDSMGLIHRSHLTPIPSSK